MTRINYSQISPSFFRWCVAFMLTAVTLVNSAQAQITVTGNTNTTPDLAASYLTIGDCFTALNNTLLTMEGPVTFNVPFGHAETQGAQLTLSNAVNLDFPIIFQKSGVGANPVINNTGIGITATSTFGGFGDAVIRLDGNDNITFDGIDLTASSQGVEYGYYLQKTSATDACQNVTIKNCTIDMTRGTSVYVCGIYSSNGTTSASSATGFAVSANSGRTENLLITGNTITDVFCPVNLRGYSTLAFYDQNVTVGTVGNGNTFTNFGGVAGTTYGVYMIYQTNPTVSYNTINNMGGGGIAHPSQLYGAFYSTVSGVVVGNNNNITLNTSGTSSVQGLYNNNTVTSVTFNNNTFFGGTIAATATSYLIYASSATNAVTVSGNVTSGTILKTGASGLLYGYYNFGGPTGGTATISSNNFSNITLSGTSTFNGIRQATAVAQTANVTANTISNITCPGAFTGIEYSYSPGDCNNNTIFNITGGAAVTGMLVGNTINTGTSNIYNNNISTMSSTGASTVAGIQSAASGAGNTNNIYKNIICSLSGSNASSSVYGLSITASKTVNAYNNLIGHLTAPSATGTDAVRGISITSTTTTSDNFISYNTVYLNASGAGNFGSSGLFHTTSATATTSNLTMRNNILYNNSTPSGTGVTAAYRRSSVTNTNYNALSNRNLFWGGAPGASQLIFTNGTNSYDILANYQAYIVTQDQNSVTENVVWENTTCGHADYLKYENAIASAAESGAANIAGITTDVNNTIRQGNGGYTGTGSAPDIGAWELEGALPGCGIPALAFAQTSNANPCNNATITLSLNLVYGLGFTYQWEESTVSAAGPYNTIGGANGATYITSTSQTRWYRCIVTCTSSTISTTSVEVQVTIATPLNGTYVIDNTGGGDYISFAAAIADLSCLGVSGPVTFDVVDGQVFPEATNLECTFTGTSTNTITFKKQGAGINPKIQRIGTSGTTDYILKLTGVDYYTFNGIDFEQTGTSASDWVEYGVWITNASATNGSQNNTIKNGVITLSNANASARGVNMNQATTATSAAGANSTNKFLNMTVTNSYVGYNITGASTILDDANEINIEFAGLSLISVLGDGTVTGSMYGVFATYQTNFKVKNTEMTGFSQGGTSLMYGVTCQTSALNSAEISNNHIHGFTGAGTMYGIYLSSISIGSIHDNRIHDFDDNTATLASVKGIYVTATGAVVDIYNNRIYDLLSNGLTTTTVAGIEGGTGTFNIYNNMISDLRAPASTNTTGATRGISITGGTASAIHKIYYNSVYLNDVGTVAGYTSAGIHNSSTTPILDIRNNVIENVSDVTIGTRAVAFWKTSATDNVSVDCNNNMYYAGTPGAKNLIYFDGTNSIQSITAYQGVGAIAPAEAASQTEDVTWQVIINGVLRPDATIATYIESGGQNIAGNTVDFENDARSGYPLGGQTGGGGFSPDMGADEGDFTFLVPPVPDCATYDAPANGATDVCSYGTVTLDWTAAITGGTVTLGYDVYFGTNPIPPFVTNVTPSNYSPTGLLPNTTYYWKIVPKNASGDAVGCLTYSFTTINAAVTSASGDTRCGSGTVNLTASGAGTFNWYTTASGGSPVATGSPYSPSVSATTSYWVSANDGGITGNVGQSSPTSAGGSVSSSTLTNHFMIFSVLAPSATINTVTIYPTAALGSNYNIIIQNSGLTQIFATGNFTNTVTGGTTPQTVTLNAVLPAGTGYRMGVLVNAGMNRNTTGAVYPYTLPGVLSISGNTFDVNYYYYFYNWSVSTGCESPRTMVTATVETPATVNAGSNLAICDGSTATMAGSFGGGATSATWSTAGDGSFDNTTLMNAVYTPGATDISNGSVVLTLTTDDPAGVCTAASDNMTLTIYPSPVVTGTVTDETCLDANDGTIDITPSGGTGPYSCAWTGPTFSTIVVPKTAAHPYFGSGSGSGFELDGVEGMELTLVRGVTYNFSINSPGHPLYISTDADGAGAGEVLAGVTGSQTDFGILTFTPNAGHPNLLYYQCFNHLNMGWKINIVDGITNCDLSSLMPGDYEVTVTDANGCTAGDNFTVDPSVTPCCTPPVIGACPSNISQCDIYTATWTDPTATGTSPTVTCVPASGSTFSAGTTTVTCTATNGCGSDNCSFTVTVNETPVIGACPSNIEQCESGPAAVSFSTPTATGTPAPSVTCVPASGSTFAIGTTTVTCTATNSCGSDNCSFTVTLNQNPSVTGTVTDESCEDANDGAIDISISGGTGPYTCSWTGPTFSTIVVPKTAAHPYFGSGSGSGFELDGVEGMELTLVRGVTYTFSINSPGHPLYISTDADGAGAGEVLAGVTGSQTDFGILTFTPNAGHPNLLYYQCYNHLNMGWKINIVDGITNCDLSSLMPGDYEVAVTDANGCIGGNTFTVNASVTPCCTPPVIGACPSNISQCDIYTATWTDPTATGTSPTVTCVPASGSTFTAGTTTVTCTATNGCGSDNCSFTVTVNETPVISACPSNITQCDVYTAAWTDPTATGTPAASVVCVPASGSTFSLGTTTVTCTATNSCGTDQCTFTVTISASPTVNAGADQTICYTGTATMSGSIGGGASSAAWSTLGDGTFDNVNLLNAVYTPGATDITSGTVTLVLTTDDPAGPCTAASDQVVVTILTAVPAQPALPTGPFTACTGDVFSYSIPAVPTASSYTWTSLLPAYASVLGSGTSATISYFGVLPGGTSSWPFSVVATNACGNSPARTFSPRNKISVPSFTTGQPSVVCQNTTGVVYSVNPVSGASSYTWSITGAGATIIGLNTGTSITVNFGTFTSVVISVTATNACMTTTARSRTVTSAPATPGTITGSSYVCPNGTYTYSVTPVPGASSYLWTGPVGSSVVGTGSSVSITFGSTVPAGSTVNVKAVGACANQSAQRSKGVANGIPNIPSAISGLSSGQCGQTGVSYSVIPNYTPPVTSYTWTVNNGASVVGPATLSSVTIDFPSSFATVLISVAANNACGTGATRTLTVNGAPGLPAVISGNAVPCASSTESYSTTGSSGATSYNWTVPAGATILGPATGSSIVVQWGSTSGNVSVQAVNACGNSAYRSLACVISCRQSQVNTSAGSFSAEVYPNPATQKATVKFTSSTAAQYQLNMTDLIGRTVLSTGGTSTEGINMIDLDLNNLAKGVYMLNIMSGDNSEQIRLIVE